MILQLTVPKPSGSIRAGLKAFLTGYFDSIQDDVTLIYSVSERDVWFVLIFIKNEEINFDKFVESYKKADEELKSHSMVQSIKDFGGTINGHFWDQISRDMACSSLSEYRKWQKRDTIQGAVDTIKKEIAEGNDKKE